MDTDASINSDNKEQLHIEETYHSCKVDFIEVVPLMRDADDSITTESFSEDWFGEVREVDFADVKHEPNDVCCVLLSYSINISIYNMHIVSDKI